MGLARGASLDNAVVISEGKVINRGGVRFDDEFVRHKILDAIGDLYLAGHPIIGTYVAKKSGHALNNLLLRKMFSEPETYEIVSFEHMSQAPLAYQVAAEETN